MNINSNSDTQTKVLFLLASISVGYGQMAFMADAFLQHIGNMLQAEHTSAEMEVRINVLQSLQNTSTKHHGEISADLQNFSMALAELKNGEPDRFNAMFDEAHGMYGELDFDENPLTWPQDMYNHSDVLAHQIAEEAAKKMMSEIIGGAILSDILSTMMDSLDDDVDDVDDEPTPNPQQNSKWN